LVLQVKDDLVLYFLVSNAFQEVIHVFAACEKKELFVCLVDGRGVLILLEDVNYSLLEGFMVKVL
jgi:hypothetical protein